MTGRRFLPSFTGHTAHGAHASDPYTTLYGGRVVFVGTEVDDTAANDIVTQLLTLEGDDPRRPIQLYVNSPGGEDTALFAVHDTMNHIRCDVETVCLGQAASTSALLLAAGTPGKRYILPNARVLVHQPVTGAARGQASDLAIQAAEALRLRDLLEAMLADRTGRPVERIHADMARERVFTAAEAVEYGIADAVLPYRKLRR